MTRTNLAAALIAVSLGHTPALAQDFTVGLEAYACTFGDTLEVVSIHTMDNGIARPLSSWFGADVTRDGDRIVLKDGMKVIVVDGPNSALIDEEAVSGGTCADIARETRRMVRIAFESILLADPDVREEEEAREIARAQADARGQIAVARADARAQIALIRQEADAEIAAAVQRAERARVAVQMAQGRAAAIGEQLNRCQEAMEAIIEAMPTVSTGDSAGRATQLAEARELADLCR